MLPVSQRSLPVKALTASFVVVGVIAIGLLLLVGYVSQEPAHGSPLAAPPLATIAILEPKVIAALPSSSLPDEPAPRATVPPTTIALLPTRSAPPDRQLEAWAAPTVLPTFPAKSRNGCDPAYPDEKTCIPPGPPFAQGCAITDERRFTVVAPDPQALDHDGDGIGCEPVGSD
jgi:hypothetical protein